MLVKTQLGAASGSTSGNECVRLHFRDIGNTVLKSNRNTYFSALWSFVLSCVLLAVFCVIIEWSTKYPTNLFYFFYGKNLLGLSLLYTGIICGMLVFIFSDVRVFFFKGLNSALLLIFVVSVWLFVNETNVLNLFMIYELFLLPSFYLVYYLSPNRRSIVASVYFLTWTQFGSLLVLAGIVTHLHVKGSFDLSVANGSDDAFSFWLIFLGFGIKIPMWPFYYWLTKTHVEASSFFSMYLSGFLVKTAVFLFIKFYAYFSCVNHLEFFLVLFCVGAVDSSIKMWHQTDLKKLIAYTTVQEMNFLCVPILWNDLFGETIVALFIATHCLLSCIFFFYIDVISKRYNTRVSSQITGLAHTMPTFSFIIFLSWVLFSGLPYTIKFSLEICIFTLMLNYNFVLMAVVLVVMNVLGIVGFSKNIFNSLFGAPVLRDFIVNDLLKREIALLIILMVNLVTLNYVTLLVW